VNEKDETERTREMKTLNQTKVYTLPAAGHRVLELLNTRLTG
jgi:hypothetical protein